MLYISYICSQSSHTMWLWLRIRQSKHDTNTFNLPFQPPHNVFILYIKIGNLSVFMKLLSFELPIAFSFEGEKNVFSVILWTNTPLFKQHKETKSWKCVFCPTFASEHRRVCISVSTVFVWLISVTGVCAQRRVSYPFHSLDLISNSPYFLLYNSYHVGSENLVMGRLVILLLIFLFILVTCLLDIVFIF